MKTCPVNSLVEILEALDPVNFDKLRLAAEVNPYQRIMQAFPNQPDRELRRLYNLVRADQIRCKDLLRKIKQYSENGYTQEILMDARYNLGKHVQNCRAEGFCFDHYMVWILEKAEEERKAENLEEEYLPELVIQKDANSLRLLVGN